MTPAPPEPPTGKKARTRRTLLEAAGELFARKGVDATTVDEIAETAGVSVGSIYKHFGSKEALAIAFIVDAFVVMEGYLDEAHAAESPIQRVFNAGEAYFRFAQEQPVACRFALARRMDPAADSSGDPITKAVDSRIQKAIMRIAADLKESMRIGEVPVTPIDETMVFLWGSWSGVVALMIRADSLAIPPGLADRALAFGRAALMAGFNDASHPGTFRTPAEA
ncbi:MAG: TetR/AcrR family transcriptional regulator [Solirubrobacteraceae bacterium]|nr:TetR/AcrR family transcriptional regulator [Patulibacter sp.]